MQIVFAAEIASKIPAIGREEIPERLMAGVTEKGE